jgi:hypothetical protein
MENKNEHFSLNNIIIIIFLIKTPKKTLTNIIKRLALNKIIKASKYEEILDSEEKEKERKLIQIKFINKFNNEHLLTSGILDNKIIFVEPIKSWKKYGLKTNAHSLSLFNELMNLFIFNNNNCFSFNEKINKFIFNIIKSRIKKIKENGSSTFCALFFNKELNRMISVSIGNILYSILRETNSQKYEIIYSSKEQYHDINIPYQISPLNQDYKSILIHYHIININDIIIVSNNKKVFIDFNEHINNKNDINYNFFDIKENDEKGGNVFFYVYKIISENNNLVNNDNISIFSTSQGS